MFTKSYCALGYRCNNNCLICVVDAAFNKDKNMTTKQVLEFYDKELEKNKNIDTIEFSGGEPTIRKDFLYLVNTIASKYPYLSFCLLTNGRNFCNFAFAQEFSKYNVVNVITALHHYIEDEHDKQTQANGSFRQTCMGIKNLSELDVPVTVKIIVTKLNYKAMPQMVEFVARNFPLVKNMSINGLDIRARAEQFKDEVAVSFTKYIPYVHKAIDTANKYNINMVLYSIPLCVLDGKYRKYAGEQPDIISLYKSPGARVQNKTEDHGYVKECYNCEISKGCYGTWFSYYDVFGTGELNQKITADQRTIVFNVCGVCNNDCLFCSEEGSQPLKDESLEKLKEKIDLLKIKKKESIVLMGGEPTMFRDIIKLVKHISGFTENISMTTNGRKLQDRQFAKNIASAGVNHFCVDIHGSRELHNKITQRKESFDQTMKGIENLLADNCAVSVKVIMHKMNYKYLKSIAELIYKKFSNKTDIIFSFISINGSAIKNRKKLSVSASKIAPYLDSAIDFLKSKEMTCRLDMFPLCVLKNWKEMASVREKTIHLDEKRESEEAANNSICKTCALYKKTCDGVWASYIKEYGISEFIPH
ncbi:MAG: hypothetical protein DRN66_00570 [Candidatus Nanohalarchaeota archaeon]|nr:MAG: hypothetical protein DRN66_00570 [Candidatus Nanohaloarchaeota archaeon]